MPNCPYCEEVLSFCDHVLRHEKQAGGKKQWYLIERWKCNKCPTKKLHRALPDFLAPYKHYSVDIIADTSEHMDTLGKQAGADSHAPERTVFAFGLAETLCRVKKPCI